MAHIRWNIRYGYLVYLHRMPVRYVHLCDGEFNNGKKNKSTARNHPNINRFYIRNLWHTSCECLTKSANCQKRCYTEGNPKPI